MDPDGVYEAQGEHDHQDECATVADERKWQSSDGHEGDGHSDVLIYMEKDLRGKTHGDEETELVSGMIGGKKTAQEEKAEYAEQKAGADEAPLFANGGENVIRVNRSAREKALLDLRVGSFESFPYEAAGTNGDHGLVDGPARAFRIDLGVKECDDPFALIVFETEVHGEGESYPQAEN